MLTKSPQGQALTWAPGIQQPIAKKADPPLGSELTADLEGSAIHQKELQGTGVSVLLGTDVMGT